ncbi:hypothetical protein N5C12_18495 [Comamonas aquatica]|uniref:hypothetical protein n=1 Tax=Comamonas aquatica TaxID=225991 RepID=UPI0024479CBD|nr:hypothetical protein [Comamonas aquatica]MDH0901312.1 hypothetical protein [Comamonas aquatica]
MRLIKSLVFIVFPFIALKAHAIDQMYNWNGLEFVTSGNVTHVHPASPQSTILRGGWTLDISDVEPKATATHSLPYKNSSGALVTVKPRIDPSKVSSRVAQGLKNAAAGAASTGNGYIALGALACGLFDCSSAVSALADWGINQLNKNSDGNLFVQVPDPNLESSTGYEYIVNSWGVSSYSPSASAACAVGVATRTANTGGGYTFSVSRVTETNCYANVYINGEFYTEINGGIGKRVSSCPTGWFITSSGCVQDAPKISQPLETYLESNYIGKGWDHRWAKMTAAIVASGGNVFTDGTSTDITGPAIVPVVTSESKSSVSLIPGTTTPAPAGHSGPTDSGTQTTTTTTTAKNTYSPAPLSPASSVGPATGPSITTTQETKTITSITNNVTNITNIVNETTTEKDEAPEEAPTDTPFADLPELYKQKYPDGLIGVLRTQTAAMKATPLFQLPMQLMGDLPQTGQCPSWQLDLSLASWASFGTYNVGADCAIWDFAGWVIVISAFLLARQLIFGG